MNPGNWSLWTEEINGYFHRMAIHQSSCPSTLAMLSEIASYGDESYTLTTDLSWSDILYLHNTAPLRFVDSDVPVSIALTE